MQNSPQNVSGQPVPTHAQLNAKIVDLEEMNEAIGQEGFENEQRIIRLLLERQHLITLVAAFAPQPIDDILAHIRSHTALMFDQIQARSDWARFFDQKR